MTCSIWKQRALDAEARVRELGRENHELRQAKRWHQINEETRQKLAAANALLERCMSGERRAEWADAVRRHLAGQPAEPVETGFPRESLDGAAEQKLAALGVWADTYGATLVPNGGAADTYGDGIRAAKAQVKAHLAGQPAAPSRTEAEQAVLDAWGAVPEHALRSATGYGTIGETCRAELARRGLN